MMRRQAAAAEERSSDRPVRGPKQETEVVADLRELDSEALAGRRQSNVGAAVGRGSDQVFAVVEVDAGDFGEVLNGEGGGSQGER